MSNEQKLREALHKAKAALSLALSDVDWRKDSLTQPVIHKAYNCAHEALALPTADHLPDAGEMVVDHFPDATKMIETAVPVCELPELPEPDSFLFQHDETGNTMFVDAQQVEWGFEKNNPRLHKIGGAFTEGQMRAYARAALSAGDAVDAQRYRWLMDNCTLGIKQNGVGWSLNTSACVAPDCIKDVGAAIDAAMRKDKP